MASDSVQAAMSPTLHITEYLPPNSNSVIIPPPEALEHPPASSLSSKSAVRSPAEPKNVTEAQDSKIVKWILRRKWRTEAVRRVDVACRIAAVSLCLISFSIMAADKNRGWTTDAFDFYKEYRYCLSVNVIGFVYAGFQAYAEVHHMSSKKHVIRWPMGKYFNFAMDQIMAYLLISASSAATARTNYWVTNWGSDPFPNMISGSVAVSFLAFLAFALSSLISAYNLFNRPI